MKIAFLTERMITGHGVDLVVDRIADGLADKGYDCTVYCYYMDETFTGRKSYRIQKLPYQGHVNFYIYERRTKKFAQFFNELNIDLFIIQSFPFYSLVPLLKVPVIIVDHGIITISNLPLKRKIFFKYLQLSQNLYYFIKAKEVICVSNYLLSQLPSYIKKKALLIYNGCDHYHYAKDKISSIEILEFRSGLGLTDNNILLLYVGRLNLTNQPYKGLSELISIYQNASGKNKNIKLLAIGYGSKNDEELLKNLGVLCISNVPEEMMPLIYCCADIYTTCSKWEGFDLPAVEAQYFSKPVICYRIGAHPEVVLDGKTGYIVNSVQEFEEKIFNLSEDKILREEMGASAKEFIKRFYWQNSIDNYDREIRKVLNIPNDYMVKQEKSRISIKASAGRVETIGKRVTIIIVNYNSSYPCIKDCLDSIKNQTYNSSGKIDILIFDNNSQDNVLSKIKDEYRDIKIINSDKNLGLGEALNQAIYSTDSEYVLISNFDVVYDKRAVEELVEEINKLDKSYIGLAPKIKLFYQKDYIESVGINLNNSFYIGYNGIGQLDLGQYNKNEDVFGISFTSAFLKREYFMPDKVGSIDSTFFLFYEDVDFCYRANLLGYKFKSCPTAICYHRYAYSFKDEATSFQLKYYYQKLNCIKTVYKNTEPANMARIIKIELGIQKQNLKDENLKKVAKKIFKNYKRSLSYLKKQRAAIQIIRQVTDFEILKYQWGEFNHFDVVRNEPVYSVSNLLLTYRRLFALIGGKKYEEYVNYLLNIENTKFRIEIDLLRNLLHSKLEYEPLCVHAFIDRIS
jgi:GT2 family glycosyltransferase/glycosyltransferase involved in cell wall biosynthesis